MSADLIAQMRALRTTCVDLGDGISVDVMRPTALQLASLLPRLDRGDVLKAELCMEHTTGWHGVTEAALLGASIGSSAPVPFSRDLWREAVSDRPRWVALVADRVINMIETHLTSQGIAAKKSSGSSTPAETGSYSATTDPSPVTPSA